MKIVFTAGGTGGHFYPLIAVAQQVNKITLERKLLTPALYYIGPIPYDKRALYENNIIFKQSPAGKLRRYVSLLNVVDAFKTVAGVAKSIVQLFVIYPDVVFSKGGYASFPTLFAARLLRIPVVIHESDASPGRVHRWAGKFAKRIAVSFPEIAEAFDPSRVALTGNPVRQELYTIAPEGGREFLDLDPHTPTLVILGGSQGAQRINDTVIDTLPKLVERYQIIHQVGAANLEEVERTARVVLEGNPHALRYKPFDFLNVLALRMAAGAASLIISRAGAGSIFEIALWGIPSILIPIPEHISHDQRKNAFAYSRTGAATVIEEGNLSANVLISEIERILGDQELRTTMGNAAKQFAKPNAARVIAEEIVEIAIEHETRK